MAEASGSLYGGDATPPGSRIGTILVAVTVLVVGLLNAIKPVHIDDALYLSIAKQILQHPFDPYGFTINWQHYDQLAYKVSISPPLLSYYHAVWMWLGAGDGFLLHLDMIPFLALLAWSLVALVNRVGRYGEWAAVFVLLSPGVFAGTNLMLDVPTTACLVAGVECLFRAIDRDSIGMLIISGLLGAAGVLIKYPGIVFVGVCLAVAVFRGSPRALFPAAICIAAFLSWQAWSQSLYGAGQVQQATNFLARFQGEGGEKSLERVLQVFVLIGSTFPIWVVPIIHGRSRIRALLFAAACTAAGGFFLDRSHALRDDRSMVVGFLTALFLGSFAIVELFITAIRRPISNWAMHWTALLWIVGVVSLAVLTAPFVAVRYLLPALPAIIVVQWSQLRPSRFSLIVTIFFTAIIGGAVALADLRWARFYPETIGRIRVEHPQAPIYFSGHWGLQWYAEKAGMSAWSAGQEIGPPGSLLVVPKRADPTPILWYVSPHLKKVDALTLSPAPFGIILCNPRRPDRIGVNFYGWEFPHLPWGLSAENTETITVAEPPTVSPRPF